ncbi:MAG: VWA domain-containing protein [Planctomycetes bacterium]|nr:VWA domain-containing protein [Planctomycetota bacterium]
MALVAAGVTVLLLLVGETLHWRRLRRHARLFFGPEEAPRPWARTATLLRPLAAGGLAWGFVTLMQVQPVIHQSEAIADEDWRHLVLVLDVSPSMMLRDAGPNGDQSRRERAKDLVDSLFERVPIGKFKITVVATFNGAKPVVEDTRDIELVRHVMSAIEMRYAFKAGPTRLFDGIAEAARIGKYWRAKSALLVIVTDGDTVPATGMPELPPSFGGTLVVGVGDPIHGKFLAGHQSRQDTSTLRQVAIRLGGEFHDGNKRHVPSDILAAAAADSRKPLIEQLTLREYAMIAVVGCSALLALLPLLLHYFGSAFQPGVPISPPTRPSTRGHENALVASADGR